MGISEQSAIGISATAPGNATTEVDETVTFVGEVISPPTMMGKLKSVLGFQPSNAEFFARPVRIYQATEATLATSLYVFQLWSTNAAILDKLAHYSGIRGTFCVRIQHNGSMFRIGKRMFALDMQLAQDPAIPTPINRITSAANTLTPYELSTYQIKGFCNPWTAETLDLKMPFYYNASYYPKGTTTGPVLKTVPIVATYAMDNSTITQENTYVIYAWMEDVELVRPSAAQSDRENSYRAVSGLVGQASDAAKSFGMSTTPVDIAKKFGDSVATALGYSRPTMPLNANVINAYAISSTSTANGDVAEVVMADMMINEEPVDAASLGFGSDDDTVFAKIAAIPGLIDLVNINNPAIDTVLWSVPVRPSGKVITTNTYSCSPVAYIANMFNFWRGDIIYTFDFVANPFVKGLFRIEFDPAQTVAKAVGSTSTPNTNTVTSIIIDLNSESSATMRCAWNQLTNSLRRSEPWSAPGADSFNGYINVYCSSPLMIPTTNTPAIGLAIWQHCEDAHFYEYDPGNISTYSTVNNKIQSDPVLSFGCELTSMNQVCRIASMNVINMPSTGTSGDYYTLTANVPNIPFGIYNPTGASATQNVNLAASPTCALIYASNLFLSRRGGTRTKILTNASNMDWKLSTCGVVRGPCPDINTGSPSIARGTAADTTLTGYVGSTNFPYIVDGSLNLELRNNRRSMFTFTDARSWGGARSSTSTLPSNRLRMRWITPTTGNLIQVPTRLILYWSGDDNYTLNQFWCVPLIQDVVYPPLLQSNLIPDIEDLGKPGQQAAATLLSLTRVRLQRQPQDDPSEDGDSEDNDDLYSGVLAQPQSDECLPFTVSFRGPRARLTTQKEAEASSDSEDP